MKASDLLTLIVGLVLSPQLFLGTVGSQTKSPVVATPQGKLKGSLHTSRGGRSYAAFKGIPYGRIVTRFEPPVPAPGWGDATRDAGSHGAPCPQWDRATQNVIGEEDCLFLNVFVPWGHKQPPGDEDEHELYPVVVFIHGGAYQFGTGAAYGGSYFVDEGVILVTLNYRLGALGFLSTGDATIQGNAGLKDQALALRWVQGAIRSFGGDPGRVSLFGTSAGGASVGFQVLSPASGGLFHCAQSNSGSVLNPWSVLRDPATVAEELAEALDCPGLAEGSVATADCLRGLDFRKIVQIRLAKWYVDPLCQFAPVVETLRPGQGVGDVFLAEEPLTLLEEGRFNKVPFIMGVASDEGLLFHAAGIMKDPELIRNLNEDWNTVAPITLLYGNQGSEVSSETLTEVSRTIRGFYFGGRSIGRESWTNLTNLYSDRYFNHGVKKAALLLAKYTPVYPFILGFQGTWSILNLYYGDVYKTPIGVSHGDDMRYLFNSDRWPPLTPDSDEERFSKQLVKLYGSYAKTGNLMDSMNMPAWTTPWLPIGPDEVRGTSKLKWFWLDLPPKVVREPWGNRVNFWDKIESQLNSLGARKKEEL